jgi:hypothetical protein
VLTYPRCKRKTEVRNLDEVEAALANMARRLGPLPRTSSGPGASSTAQATLVAESSRRACTGAIV